MLLLLRPAKRPLGRGCHILDARKTYGRQFYLTVGPKLQRTAESRAGEIASLAGNSSQRRLFHARRLFTPLAQRRPKLCSSFRFTWPPFKVHPFCELSPDSCPEAANWVTSGGYRRTSPGRTSEYQMACSTKLAGAVLCRMSSFREHSANLARWPLVRLTWRRACLGRRPAGELNLIESLRDCFPSSSLLQADSRPSELELKRFRVDGAVMMMAFIRGRARLNLCRGALALAQAHLCPRNDPWTTLSPLSCVAHSIIAVRSPPPKAQGLSVGGAARQVGAPREGPKVEIYWRPSFTATKRDARWGARGGQEYRRREPPIFLLQWARVTGHAGRSDFAARFCGAGQIQFV